MRLSLRGHASVAFGPIVRQRAECISADQKRHRIECEASRTPRIAAGNSDTHYANMEWFELKEHETIGEPNCIGLAS